MEKIKITALIVDDDKSTRDIYREAMELGGIEVITASDGGEAYDFYRRYKPGVILTGITMPKMDGFSLIEKIRKEEGSRSPFFIINSHNDNENDRKRAQEMGVDGYFVRGFSAPINVVSHINKLINAQDKKQEIVLTREEFEKIVEEEIERRLTQKKKSNPFFLGMFMFFLGGLLMLLVSFFVFYLPQKRFEDEYNEKEIHKEQDISYEKDSSFQTPQIAILSGTVVEVKEDEILIEVDGKEDSVKVKLSQEAQKNISKNVGVSGENGSFNEIEDQSISLEQIQEGDSISFLLKETISVVDFSKKDREIFASQIFVGLPVSEIRE
ncbi:MAG: response regulator [Candidatus Moranbacteria bacterium]|nr:response regulator [Candidatus Moranbacteria bacterium]